MNLNNPFNTVNVNQEIIYGVQLYDTAEGHKGSTCPETLPEGELSTQVAKTYEEQRNPSEGDLLIYRYNTTNSKGQNLIHSKITRVEGGTVYAEAICFMQGESGEGGTKVEDIKQIDTFHSVGTEGTVSVTEGYGIQWDGGFTIFKDLTQDERVAEGKTHNTIPLIPGNGIEFEVNEKGNQVKIKAKDVTSINTGNEIDRLEVSDSGITAGYKDVEIEHNGGESYHYTDMLVTLPIVEGDGIDLEIDEQDKVVRISATGGGGTTLNRYQVGLSSLKSSTFELLQKIIMTAKGRVLVTNNPPANANADFFPLNVIHIKRGISGGYTMILQDASTEWNSDNLNNIYVKYYIYNSVSDTSKPYQERIVSLTTDGTITCTNTQNSSGAKFRVVYYNDVEITA